MKKTRLAARFTAWIALIASVAMLAGCTKPAYTEQESALIVWKTPLLRYADQGFIYKAPAATKVEIYSNGSPLLRLKIDRERICASFWACEPKSRFNAKYLSRYYPPDTLERIFRGEAIFGGINKTLKRNGFTQQIQSPHKYKIDYRVLNNEIVFRDTINEIQLKVIKQ